MSRRRVPPTTASYPPDLSVIAKARTYERGFPRFLMDVVTQYQEQGVDYLAALLKGYEKAPEGMQMAPGMMYNKYFPGHGIAMPPPVSDGQVAYDDGTPGTIDQYSRDVSAFLAWTAEPHLEARKRIGFQVVIFLLVLSGLLYFTKKTGLARRAYAPGRAEQEIITTRRRGRGHSRGFLRLRFISSFARVSRSARSPIWITSWPRPSSRTI